MWKFAGGAIIALAAFFAVNLNYTTDKGVFRPIDPDRANMWHLAIKAFEEKPILGHGVRQFERQADRLEKTHGHWIEQPTGKIRGMAHSHNIFMQILVDTGMIGLISYLTWIGLIIKGFWKGARWKWAIMPLLLAIHSAGMLQYVFDAQGALLVMICLGILHAEPTVHEKGES